METPYRFVQIPEGSGPGDSPRQETILPLAPPPSTDRPTRLLLICHAESMRSSARAVTDPGLSAAGWDQASALAQWLDAHETIDTLVCSPQLRCRLTAQRVGQLIQRRPTVHPDLPGAPDARWALHPPCPEAGDSDPETIARCRAYQATLVHATRAILHAEAGKTIGLVLDPVGVATLLRAASGSQSLGIHIQPASISELAFQGGRWVLAYVNLREHLPRPSVAPVVEDAHSQEQAGPDQEMDLIRTVYNRAAAGSHSEADDSLVEGADLWRLAGLEQKGRILEIGAGSGRLALELAQAGAGEVIGVDVSPAMLEQAEARRLRLEDRVLAQRINFRMASGHNLPFSSQRFDVVVCCQVFHHLAKPGPTLEECHRVLRPRGLLVVVDMAGPEDPVKRATQNAIEAKRNPSHAAVRTVEQLKSLLQRAQFVVEKEEVRTAPRKARQWLARLNVDVDIQARVLEMLEASMETDAAGLHVRRQEDELFFDEPIAILVARKNNASRPEARESSPA